MADDTKDLKTPVDTASAETTVAKDNQLAINNPTPPEKSVADTAVPVNFSPPVTSQPVSGADPNSPEFITAKEAGTADDPVTNPIVVTEQDTKEPIEAEKITPPAAAAAKTSGPNLEEQIESLTGEIQALEAKIERLTSGTMTPAKEEAKMPPAEARNVETPKEDAVLPLPMKPNENPRPMDKSPGLAFNDIYSKPPTANGNPPAILGKGQLPAEKEDAAILGDESHSPLAIIGEILAIFGLIALVILLLSPLYREVVGSDIFAMIQSIGWLTTLMSLFLGSILLFFGKGKIVLKVIAIVALVVTAVLYVAISGLGGIGIQLGNLLGPLVDFYR